MSTSVTHETTTEHLACRIDLAYDWGYGTGRRELADLYGKAKHGQWISEDALPWGIDVDTAKLQYPEALLPIYGSAIYEKLVPKEKERLYVELASWLLSQFLHGEQGALLAATQLVASVPDLASKLYAATQVVDEARHVEVFDRYLREKIGHSYPINAHLKKLLDLILTDSRWDMKLLGMQIMVEGLALASFGIIRESTTEPLLAQLTHSVMVDEARHVAYGVLSLKDLYGDMKESERREREDFVYESAILMRDRFLFDQVWEKLGMPVAECIDIALKSESQILFRQVLFSKIVPAIKRCGLLSARQRVRFEALGILQFESSEDPFASLALEGALAQPRA